MNTILLFYITHPSKEHASNIASTLIEEKLIACSNLFPMNSEYTWLGNRCQGEEFVTIFKTTLKHEIAVEKRITELHSYDVPCIIRYTVSCNMDYAAWIKKQVL